MRLLWDRLAHTEPLATPQNDVNDRMRAILIDWLVDVHLKFKVSGGTKQSGRVGA